MISSGFGCLRFAVYELFAGVLRVIPGGENAKRTNSDSEISRAECLVLVSRFKATSPKTHRDLGKAS